MVTTLRDKLISRIIISVVLINIIFTVFIALFLENNLKNNIIEEMRNVQKFAVNTIKQDKMIDESIWKTLNDIKLVTNSYVLITNENSEDDAYVNSIIDEEELSNILKESDNTKSLIKFKKLKEIYSVTYNYPIYSEDDFYCNLIIQKDYIERYNDMVNTITMIISGQTIVVLAVIIIASIIIDRVTKPIKVLSDSMEKFTEDIYEADVIINSNDEVGQLANSYNTMKNRIKTQVGEIIKEKEKVEKLQKVSKEFFNNATHELKTPVTAISLYAQTLKDNDIKTLDDEFIYRATDRMVLESDKMKSLVEKILEVSKGNINVNKTKVEFSISKLIHEILDDVNVRLNKRNLKVNAYIEEISCYGIFENIEQIIVNLIDNSIKYASRSEINIRLYKEESRYVFEISNKCLEIPEDIKGRLLDPFIKYNHYGDMSKEISSSGLGLYLCNELAKENGSEISYKYNENTILFRLLI